MRAPAIDDPIDTPTPSDVPTQVRPSVRRPGATSSCTRPLPLMRVGAIANPVTNMTAASAHSEFTTKKNETPTASSTMPIANRTHSGCTQRRAPYSRPETSDPAANTARISPAIDLRPSSSANATVATSVAPKIAPIARNTPMSSTMPGAARIDGPPASWRGVGGGCVRRCSRNHVPPTTVATSGTTMPAVGVTPVASRVAAAGPMMKTSSSSAASSEYAVCSAFESPRSTYVHRARTSEPNCPLTPATTAVTYRTGSGASATSATMSATIPVAQVASAGNIARAWPYRSTARAISGAVIAEETISTADTRPAIAYDP